MIIEIDRYLVSQHGTFSKVRVDALILRGVELPWRDNIVGESCIPAGVYRLVPHESPKFGPVHAFQGGTVSVFPSSATVRSAILWHPANYARELQGCLATGRRVYETMGMEIGVANSRDSLKLAHEIASLEEEHIAIVRWDF